MLGCGFETMAGELVEQSLLTGRTATATYDEATYVALLDLSDESDTYNGLDGRAYWSFEGCDGWRVLLVGKAYEQPARYR